MAKDIIQFEELNFRQVDDLDREKTLFFLAAAPIEVHGPHLPIGTDFWIATSLSRMIGLKFLELHPDWDVVLLPPLPLGADTLPMIGSVEISPRTIRNVVYQVGAAVAKHGFRHILVADAHGGPRHVVALEEAAHRVSKKFGVRMISPVGILIKKVFRGELGRRYNERMSEPFPASVLEDLCTDWHAGHWETSAVMSLKPQFVDPEYKNLPAVAPPRIEFLCRVGDKIERFADRRGAAPGDVTTTRFLWDFLSGLVAWVTTSRESTYVGAPARATAEFGRVSTEIFCEEMIEIIEDQVQGRVPATQVHSALWKVPMLRVDFPVYAGLGAAGAVGLGLWWRKRRKAAKVRKQAAERQSGYQDLP